MSEQRASAWARGQLRLLNSSTAKLVFLAIGTYADDKTGEAHPRQQTLATETNLSIRTVKRAVTRCVELGLMSVEHKGNQYSETVYRLNVNVPASGTFTHDERDSRGTTTKKRKGQGGQVKVPPVVSEGDTAGNAIKEGISNISKEHTETSLRSVSPPTEQSAWDHPPWFDPLTKLKGYRRIDHSTSAKTIEGICFEADVDPTKVVAEFTAYWPVGKHKHGWSDPVKALRTTIEIQISKALNGKTNVHLQRQTAAESWGPRT